MCDMARRFWKRQSHLNNKFICFYCNRQVFREVPENTENKATIDHVIPRCLGGTNFADNLVISCRKCNIKKSVIENNNCTKLRQLGVIFYV